MSYGLKDLAQEVSQVIEEAIAGGRSMPATEIVALVLERHPLPPPYDAAGVRDFVTLACTWMVREQVHKILATLKRKNLRGQAQLPGFARLLPAYIVIRNDVEMIVVTPQLTDAEIETKALEYEAMAEGCLLHAGELRRYALERREAA
jgi:hypothetical protein